MVARKIKRISARIVINGSFFDKERNKKRTDSIVDYFKLTLRNRNFLITDWLYRGEDHIESHYF